MPISQRATMTSVKDMGGDCVLLSYFGVGFRDKFHLYLHKDDAQALRGQLAKLLDHRADPDVVAAMEGG